MKPTSRRWILSILLLLIALAAGSSSGLAQRAPLQRGQDPQQNQPQSVDDLSPQALGQIAALMDEKASRTPAQQKMDSQLVYAVKMARGEAIAQGVPQLHVGVATDGSPLTIDVRASV